MIPMYQMGFLREDLVRPSRNPCTRQGEAEAKQAGTKIQRAEKGPGQERTERELVSPH